jgi:hypothetical protein
MAMVWRTSPSLTMGLLVLRVLRALCRPTRRNQSHGEPMTAAGRKI